MEQSKHSEDKIIKLGEKLVKELNVENSVNTLARWMSHYLAELINDIDNANSEEEKKLLQKECCDLILKVWSQKESLPIRIPLDDLKPIIEILQVVVEKKRDNILPRWIRLNYKLPRENQWATFADTVKNNSEDIFNIILELNLNEDILGKDKEWMEENREFLSSEQTHFLQLLDVFTDIDSDSGSVDLNNLELSDDNTKRVEYMIDKVEKLIDEQKNELLKIKKKYKK